MVICYVMDVYIIQTPHTHTWIPFPSLQFYFLNRKTLNYPFPFLSSLFYSLFLQTNQNSTAERGRSNHLSLLSDPIQPDMKQLIRRLSRVADASSQYSLLRSHSSGRGRKPGRRRSVPDGHVPVYVGDDLERFVVSAELLNHPVFVGLLNRSAQEYGYDQKGVLHIPCHVLVFERVMEALRLGADSCNLHDLLHDCS